MKFIDVVTAVASLVVISLLLDSVLLAVFVRVLPARGTDIAGILSALVASLIVGYVFALKIQRPHFGRVLSVSFPSSNIELEQEVRGIAFKNSA